MKWLLDGNFSIGKVLVDSGTVRLFNINSNDTTIESWNGDIELNGGTFCGTLKTDGGDVKLREVLLSSLSINTLSGNVELTTPRVAEQTKAIANSQSGDAALNGTDIVNSGTASLEHIQSNDTTIESKNGDIELHGGTFCGTLKTAAGDVKIREVLLSSLRINTESGDVELTAPSVTESTKVIVNSTSGDVSVNGTNGPWSQINVITGGALTVNWEWEIARNSSSPFKHGKVICYESGFPGAVFDIGSANGDVTFS